MLSNNQRKFLKKKAHALKPVFQVGKTGVHPQFLEEIDRVLEKRELIKVQFLQNTFEDPTEASSDMSRQTNAELVQVIGHTAVLYRPSKDHKRIDLPKK
ncbi:ribosome assembly RNA-binding protein YhbY [Sporolactobacillus inulinus]|jgi:RNA-binding protein|uniref:RNA-binding protein n=1 Tax=Sporolactobacillus inulinus CASD TaxID=1069536 RepID=A0A0U1QRF3_9BACL|nr:ribosome assembly RNA-binding protein YhbY [Sporolactobacillus inulinus]KLI03226.1 RNA-binding protein [Sporolactobacillus inulinus CASD]GEB76220.1 RNA-binding protein [Sporolactobacillus inulinus]